MKKTLIALLVMVFMVSVIDDASAQRRKKRKKREDKKEQTRDEDRDEEYQTTSFLDKLNSEIKLGNFQFFGNQFSLSLKANTAYKLNNTFSAGVGAKMLYDYINNQGVANDFGLFSYGGLAFARVKLSPSFYLQGEYNLVSYETIDPSGFFIERRTNLYPTAGLGYMQSGFDWSYGFEILFIFDGEVRDYSQTSIVEYWINFSHNF